VANQLGRRNLTPSQKGPLGIELKRQLAIEARKRRGARTDLVEKIPPSDFGKARDQAAKLLGINPHYLTDSRAGLKFLSFLPMPPAGEAAHKEMA
jgi:hypothetical protein